AADRREDDRGRRSRAVRGGTLFGLGHGRGQGHSRRRAVARGPCRVRRPRESRSAAALGTTGVPGEPGKLVSLTSDTFKSRESDMANMKGPAIFLAQFAGDEAPFNSLDSITRWAAGHGYVGVQIPSWDGRLFDLKKCAESQTYADEVKGLCR